MTQNTQKIRFEIFLKQSVFYPTDCEKQTVLQTVGSITSSSWHNVTSDGTEVDWFPNSTHPSISEDPWTAEFTTSPPWLQIDLGEKRRITGSSHVDFYAKRIAVHCAMAFSKKDED